MNDKASSSASTTASALNQADSDVSAQLPPPPSYTSWPGYKTSTGAEKRKELRAWYTAQLSALTAGASDRESKLRAWRSDQQAGLADPDHPPIKVEMRSVERVYDERMKAESLVKSKLIDEYNSLSKNLTAEHAGQYNVSV